MTFTIEEMIEARDKAYKEAGHNTYFGNGFAAGWLAHEKKMEESRRCKIIDDGHMGFHEYECGNCRATLFTTAEKFCHACGYKFIKGE